MRSFMKTMLAAITLAAFVHMLTGWSPALVIIPLLAVLARLISYTRGDGPRAMRICAEEADK